MPAFEPFRGIRYDTTRLGSIDLAEVAAPPYDVIDAERLAQLQERSPHNAVHLTLPVDHQPGDRYEQAARQWSSWQSEGVLVPDPTPCFYVYRVEFEDEDGRARSTTGVIGALEVRRPGDGDVLPHERTMPKPKGDRLELIRATRANLEPIWGLSLAKGLSDLLEPEGPVLAQVTDTRGAVHRLFAVDDEARSGAIADLVRGAPVVIADGHHRYETSLHYRDEQRAAGHGDGEHDRIMCLVVELSEEQLAVQPIHRVVRGIPGPDLRAALAGAFEIVPLAANDDAGIEEAATAMTQRAVPALVDPQGVALLVPRDGALDDALAEEPEPVRSVDAARFEAGIAPVLEAVGAEVEYRHDRSVVAALVRKGDADAAVLLRPVDVATIEAVARSGERMPQKTTFFHPKPSTGLVFRSLDVT